MIRDSRKGKTGFFGTRGVAHEVIRPMFLRHEFVAKFKHASLRCRIRWGLDLCVAEVQRGHARLVPASGAIEHRDAPSTMVQFPRTREEGARLSWDSGVIQKVSSVVGNEVEERKRLFFTKRVARELLS
jgi:hypothetical protein